MPPTDISERGLESLIVDRLTRGVPAPVPSGEMGEQRGLYRAGGWVEGAPQDFDREHAVDVPKLMQFLDATQPQAVESLGIAEEGPARTSLLNRLSGELAKRGVVDLLRSGLRHNQAELALFYGAPTPGNVLAAANHAANVFSVTRQVRYSLDETARSLDLVLFVNGLPFATFELKNQLTKQTVHDAIRQYKERRDPREILFRPKRCAVHFAVDDSEIRMCTELRGEDSWFLPFNKGWNDGAGNPPNPRGLKTAWLWEEILTPASLTDIIENYAQVVTERLGPGKKRERQVFPRYHQLDVVRKLLKHAAVHGPGPRYLIEHSAGSGKSNSIAWLAHQLIDLQEESGRPLFETVIVVTDRVLLDRQLRETIKQFTRVGATVGAAENAGDLRRFIEEGKRIVISTVQKFPFILDEIGNEHRDRRFAIVIDEAHSSQGGKTTTAINQALGQATTPDGDPDDVEDVEDQINRIMASRKYLGNASYFAFTATPKNKTLEIFGTPDPERPGTRQPFHVYSMKQAIQEGFIMDVLAGYTPVQSWYRLVKTIEGDPEYDVRQATKQLRRYVEAHDYAIGVKAAIAADHFRDKVAGPRKIGGEARAMVVVDGVNRAIDWWRALSAYLKESGSPYKALIAFSGEREGDEGRVSEGSLNGFPGHEIAERFRQDPYRFLVVADKFQTGYDEPLLHTMYVDKVLAGVKAVQTLSRLNRAHPRKHDTFVLDFANDAEGIEVAFAPYYRTTILSGETDPNKLHNLQHTLDVADVYTPEQVEYVVAHFLQGAERDALDPVLDACVAAYLKLDEEGQVEFKGSAKAFVRTYAFLAAILPWSRAEWERLSIFLNLLIPKLPAPIGRSDDLSREILEAIDLDSYRAEVRAVNIHLPDGPGGLQPAPIGGPGALDEVEIDALSAIVARFNDLFGNIEWSDRDRIHRFITDELPAKVAADPAYQNAIRNSDRENARIEHDRALDRAITDLVFDDMELFRQVSDNPDFKRWLSDAIFTATYHAPAP